MPRSRIGVADSWPSTMSAASCARSSRDPDEWFPASTDAGEARLEAADAIAICNICPVRVHCLEFSLRYWRFGEHGIWGGLVPAERDVLRRRLEERRWAASG